MKNIFEVICKKCDGKCCKTVTFLSQDDVKRLQECKTEFSQNKEFLHRKKNHSFLVLNKGKCPFLTEHKGCQLKESCRPLECLLFPLVFKYDKGKLRFYLNKKCPYLREISKKWVSKTKQWAANKLQQWTKEELSEFSKIIDNHPGSHLQAV